MPYIKIKDDWKVICKFYEIIINEIYEGKINYFDIVKLSQFLQGRICINREKSCV